jgi:hypothetical protein
VSDLERLGLQLAREQDALRSRSIARAAVRERIATLERAPRTLRPRVYAIVGAAALAAAAAAVLWRAPEPSALVAHLGSARKPVAVGAWVEAPASGEPLSLTFSDGTRIEMSPRTRMRVIEVDARGAHVLLESGHAQVAVTPRPNASWRLSVGPFAVRVLGTRFGVRWDPEGDAFALELTHGKVALSGCVFGSEYLMRVGQAVDASCRRGRLNVHELSEPQAAAPAAAPALPAPVAVVAPQAPEPDREPLARIRAPRVTPADKRDWRTLAAQGKHDQALALARNTNLAGAGAEDLALLAETARHIGEVSTEEDALLLIRRRFAGTARAALAAFALGRLEFDKRHAHEKAARWFGIYLTEQPRGPLAREARGRLIEASLAAGERERARKLAAEYLDSYPSGPHATLARGLLDEAER